MAEREEETTDAQSRRRSMARYATLAATGTGLAAVGMSLVLLLTKQLPSAALLSVVASSLAAFLAAVTGFYFSNRRVVSSREGERRWAELLTVIDEIESAAAKATDTEARQATVTQLMTDLEAHGLWDDKDANEFRNTLRLRNEFVHGEQPPTESDAVLAAGVQSARRLLKKVQVDQASE